ncbi:hypothetical protein DNU06_14410 [Putridiphycobacter roseus]|uniref:DUF3575 domain-containing protein n=1 Tax=Putridiphycobacter roseus TaxID=2219161 RepID=A0A2W1MXQ1_9FLAO|nr:hypothetical protein [Putridiphycobacter roseus]PZE16154.1 hypothetical protein DNU06_14410 [Putridiphycobacter roseus]
MKNLLYGSIILLLLFTNVSNSFCQNDYKERNWQIEVEPSLFLLKGYSFQIGRYLTESKRLNMALYSAAGNVPEILKQNIFSNLEVTDDLRIGLQIALNTRYRFNVFKDKESNPYVGLITGWEYFSLNNSVKEELRIDVLLLTPYVGAEIYLYQNILYVNPQLRLVTYLNTKYSIKNRVEKVNSVLFLPQISLGIRF